MKCGNRHKITKLVLLKSLVDEILQFPRFIAAILGGQWSEYLANQASYHHYWLHWPKECGNRYKICIIGV